MVKKGVLVAFSEIGLRTAGVRRNLTKLLAENLRKGLRWKGIKFYEIEARWERIFIFTDKSEEVAELIKGVPGIRFTAPMYLVESSDLKPMLDKISELALEFVSGKSFKVIAKRRFKKLPYTSMQFSSLLGERIIRRCKEMGAKATVDLIEPEVKVNVEIDKDHSLVYFMRFEGFGGNPIGSQSPLVSLFSGGTDSAVAAWLMLQRGCRVFPIFMDQFPFNGLRAKRAYRVFHRLKEVVLYPELTLAIAKIGTLMENLARNVKPKNICVHCKRLMLKIANKYAKKVKAKGLVTGESIGQVASQTVDNLYVISQASDLPIYRPLSGFSKEMIHDLAREIDIYELAAVDLGSCKLLPPHPTTKANLKEILDEERRLNVDSWIDDVIDSLEFKE
ncbi:tRNA 4-thiouridine(8) synthase ThiI [Candidatus Geothermarchaeota archaeon]|nr:MAG: tRNA 4-thiouridine(8) synthase ThiI [Candidatus Geothermarchaeota archaeon]